MIFHIPKIGSKKDIGKCSAGTCILSPSQITLAGKANTRVQVDAIYQSYEPPFYYSSRQFFMELRECLPGEINDTIVDTCTYCDDNIFSLNTTDKSCSPCPVGATCQGGSEISLHAGEKLVIVFKHCAL